MHTVQSGYSLTLEVRDGQLENLKNWLTEIGHDPAGNDKIPFGKSKTTLYCSIVTVDEQDSATGKKLPAMMMFLSSICGPKKEHINELVSLAGDGMRELLAFCKDVDPQRLKTDQELFRFLKKKQVEDTFYTGIQYMTGEDIQRENQLRLTLEQYINEQQQKGNSKFLNATGNSWGSELRNEIVEFVKTKPEYSWALSPVKITFMDKWVNNITLWRTLIFIAVLGMVSWLGKHFEIPYLDGLWGHFWRGFGVIALLLIVILLINDAMKHFVAGRQPDNRVRDITATQLHPVINEITLAGPLRKGWIRRVAFFLILRIAKTLKFALTIPTVVCARWIPMNNSQRLVFISNFSNTSEGYVRDFIDSKSRGRKINLIFGQGYGYPLTRLIVLKGAIDNPIPFVNDVYRNQHDTQFWYSPYKDLTVDNININRNIRKGLSGNMSEDEAREWLGLF